MNAWVAEILELPARRTLRLGGGGSRDVGVSYSSEELCHEAAHAPQHGQSAPPGSARARLPRLLRARLAALGNSALPGERPAHWAPSHCLGCSS